MQSSPAITRLCLTISAAESAVWSMSARAAACAYGPPEPIATMPCSGSSTSPVPVTMTAAAWSATASIAGRRRRVRSARQSVARSARARGLRSFIVDRSASASPPLALLRVASPCASPLGPLLPRPQARGLRSLHCGPERFGVGRPGLAPGRIPLCFAPGAPATPSVSPRPPIPSLWTGALRRRPPWPCSGSHPLVLRTWGPCYPVRKPAASDPFIVDLSASASAALALLRDASPCASHLGPLLPRPQVLLCLFYEVTRRNTDDQQQRPDDRRCADELDGLSLRLDPVDRVEQRSSADKVDAVDVAQVDRNDVMGLGVLR